ncbi:NERD domain-containing protein [Nocardioides sp. HDW12B]|uniref:NERD domain-containing protein n=1 Tax=Nocardioides sp. HDW12B TaxID=2714939 RepID=UPI00140861F6|nr:NERD domain-containing protein [Nocardioides sp. HDW12B]QIK67278.1 NERD domain-containing protein [Nocardioides sp. HDW12B]
MSWERGGYMGAGDSARNEAQRVRERAARLQRRAEMFDKGADGEARTAKALSRLGRDWVVLHDVRWPGRRLANIDHVVIGPGGIFVIDTKNWAGRLTVEGAVLRQDGRSRERTVAAAADAALAVAELAPAYASLVRPVLCFARDENLSGSMGGVMICSTSNLRRMLTSRPPLLVSARVKEVAKQFDRQLRSATEPRTAPSQSPGRTPSPMATPAPSLMPSSLPSAPSPVAPVVLAGPAPDAKRTKRRKAARTLSRTLVVTALTLGAAAAAPTVLPPLGEKLGEFFTGQLEPETDSCVEQPRERVREKPRASDDRSRANARTDRAAPCPAP